MFGHVPAHFLSQRHLQIHYLSDNSIQRIQGACHCGLYFRCGAQCCTVDPLRERSRTIVSPPPLPPLLTGNKVHLQLLFQSTIKVFDCLELPLILVNITHSHSCNDLIPGVFILSVDIAISRGNEVVIVLIILCCCSLTHSDYLRGRKCSQEFPTLIDEVGNIICVL